MSTVLDTIIDGVRLDLSARQAAVTQADLERLADQAPPALDGHAALAMPGLSLIAEVKRASPSKGALADIPDPAALAAAYQSGGASVISVLTEERRFGGSLRDLDAVREAVTVPVLRKDFMVSDYQIWEARAHGADLVLLIVAALTDAELVHLHHLAGQLGMTALVEVHADTFSRLSPLVPPGVLRIAESGITGPADAARYAAQGADAVLVGESLVRGGDAAAGARALLAAAHDTSPR